MLKFSSSYLLILVLAIALTACSSSGEDGGNSGGDDPPVVRYWGAAEILETNTGDADYPQIAMSADGSAIAVWHQSDGIRDSIWANRFNGSAWGNAVLIETNDTGDAWNPQVAKNTVKGSQ
jgi:hypothetical protein